MNQAALFENWKTNQEFINSIIENDSIELVSLDIFDTALTRLVDSPADAFALMEQRLAAEIGSQARNFAVARETTEQRAREKHLEAYGQEEIDLDAIYTELSSVIPKHIARAREIELEVERDLLVAVPDILLLTHRLKDVGRPFIFVSDMYLPSEFLAEILSACGYAGWEALYVSSSTITSKATGHMWSSVAERYPKLDKILHIGDDAWADGNKPREYGVQTALFTRVRTERRVGAQLTPNLLPFSFLQRQMVLTSCASLKPVDEKESWRILGRALGGIVLAGFLLWLKKRIQQHGIERLYFCARDGWLIQQAWQVAGLGKITGVEDRYLYVSRRPLNLAYGYLKSTPTHLSLPLVQFLTSTDGTTSIRTMLDRAQLSGHTQIERDLVQYYGSLDFQLNWQNLNGIEKTLRKYSSIIYTSLRHEYEATSRYLEQEQLGIKGHCATVDLGWNATTQRSLRAVLDQISGTMPIFGFYYGLWPSAAGNRFRAGMIESAFTSEFISCEDQPEVWSAVAILEELHMAPHETVISYKQVHNKWTPILANSLSAITQYDQATRYFHEGALEVVRSLFTSGRYGSLRLEDINSEVVRATLGAICISPSALELSLLGSLSHCLTFDHSHADSLISGEPPTDETTMRSLYNCCEWRPGAVLSWLRQASPQQKKTIQAFAKESLHFLGDRALRQFS